MICVGVFPTTMPTYMSISNYSSPQWIEFEVLRIICNPISYKAIQTQLSEKLRNVKKKACKNSYNHELHF